MQKYYARQNTNAMVYAHAFAIQDVKKFLVRPSTKTDDTTSTHYIKEKKKPKRKKQKRKGGAFRKEAREALSSGADAALNAALAEL